jgi:membrane protein YdbS with pleckstrin-like domain
MLWISAIALGLMVVFLGLAIKQKDFTLAVGLSILVALLLRICCFVVIPMVFHRVNMSWSIAQENLQVLSS